MEIFCTDIIPFLMLFKFWLLMVIFVSNWAMPLLCQKKDTEDEVREIIRNNLHLQGKVRSIYKVVIELSALWPDHLWKLKITVTDRYREGGKHTPCCLARNNIITFYTSVHFVFSHLHKSSRPNRPKEKKQRTLI